MDAAMTWQWVSPDDGCPLVERGDVLERPDGGPAHTKRNGIWHLLPTAESDELDRWSLAYGEVRRAEGRGSEDPAYYRALPWVDTTGRFGDQWRERSHSFDRLVTLLDDHPTGSVVDLGAGNAWASARLADRGWHAMAIDVNVDDADGLGAAHHHDAELTLVRAAVESIPLADASVDVVFWNASLHYATSVEAAVAEAGRVLRPGGLAVVVDSPVYRGRRAGAAMVRQQQERLGHLGAPPLRGRGFLIAEEWTHSRRGPHRLQWDDLTPHRTRLRAAVGRVRAGREIARLSFLVGRKEDS